MSANASAAPIRRLHPQAVGGHHPAQRAERDRPPLLPRPTEVLTYTVRAVVEGSQPPIWRELQLASALELVDVVEAVRTAFGWPGDLLHLCHLTDAVPGADGVVLSPDYGGWGREGYDEAAVQICEVVARVGDLLRVSIIDAGGVEWLLRLELQGIEVSAPQRQARVAAGERAHPPLEAESIEEYNIAVAQWYAGAPSARRLVWWPATHDPGAFDVAATDELVALVVTDPIASVAAHRTDVAREVVDLYLRCMADGKAVLDSLLAQSAIADPQPPPLEVAELVQPWCHLIDVVGEGVAWSRGFLAEDLHERFVRLIAPRPAPPSMLWLGVGLGLLRRQGDRVVPTAAALRARRNPEALWRHLADRMPPVRKYEAQDAALMTMLQLAAGHDPSDAVTARVLNSAGWTFYDETVKGADAHNWSTAAREALALTGAHLDSDDVLHVTDAARMFCCAALAPGSRDRRPSRYEWQ